MSDDGGRERVQSPVTRWPAHANERTAGARYEYATQKRIAANRPFASPKISLRVNKRPSVASLATIS